MGVGIEPSNDSVEISIVDLLCCGYKLFSSCIQHIPRVVEYLFSDINGNVVVFCYWSVRQVCGVVDDTAHFESIRLDSEHSIVV